MTTSTTATPKTSAKHFSILALTLTSGVLLALKPFLAIFACLIAFSIKNIISTKKSGQQKTLTALILISFITLIAFFIASKTSSFSIGNDKFQYIEYMKSMEYSGFLNQIQYHPEPVSFGILHISNLLFGHSNIAFLFIFTLSFSLITVGAWRILQEKSALFILLLASSSILLTTYGNTIRQAISVSLLVLAIGFTGRKFIALLSLSLLAHLSSIALLPFVLFAKSRYIKSTKTTLIILSASSIISFLIPEIMEILKLSGIHILEQKASIYEEWEKYDTTQTKTMFYILLITAIIANHLKSGLTTNLSTSLDQAYTRLWSLLVCTSAIMVAAQSFDKIFERYYPTFFIITTIYLCLYSSSLNRAYLRLLAGTVLAAYSTYSIVKNISSASLFYCGDPASFLQADIFSITNCL